MTMLPAAVAPGRPAQLVRLLATWPVRHPGEHLPQSLPRPPAGRRGRQPRNRPGGSAGRACLLPGSPSCSVCRWRFWPHTMLGNGVRTRSSRLIRGGRCTLGCRSVGPDTLPLRTSSARSRLTRIGPCGRRSRTSRRLPEMVPGRHAGFPGDRHPAARSRSGFRGVSVLFACRFGRH
jgi:hypothetical protein